MHTFGFGPTSKEPSSDRVNMNNPYHHTILQPVGRGYSKWLVVVIGYLAVACLFWI